MVGDIILTVNGSEINKMIELRELIYTKKPGDDIEIKVLRKSEEIKMVVTLGTK